MYLDPGFGSMIIQIVIAAIASCGVILLMMKRKIISFFTKHKDKDKDITSELNRK
jgi:hypothetical protein